MRVLIVHNRYRLRGGEDAVVDATERILHERGLTVECFLRESGTATHSIAGKLQASIGGIYSKSAAKALQTVLERFQPDVAHVHNVYPLLSPSVFPACRAAGVPVVMTCHNYRLTCPIGTHFIHGALCTRCTGGREYWCAVRNCRRNLAESATYGLRGWIANRRGWFRDDNITYIAISAFLRDFLVAEAGIPADRVHVVPNSISLDDSHGETGENLPPPHVGFAGRMSEEKGLPLLLESAHAAPGIPFRLAGDGPLRETLQVQAPANAVFEGMLDAAALDAFYRSARCLVVPSVWYETFGLVAIEAMRRGVPVVVANHGGLRELVEDGQTGVVFEPGNSADLTAKVQWLWEHPEEAAAMGARARERVRNEYSEEHYFSRLLAVYESARARSRKLAA